MKTTKPKRELEPACIYYLAGALLMLASPAIAWLLDRLIDWVKP